MAPQSPQDKPAPAPGAPAPAATPAPYGSREGQIERRHPGVDDKPPVEERRKDDRVGGED